MESESHDLELNVNDCVFTEGTIESDKLHTNMHTNSFDVLTDKHASTKLNGGIKYAS